MWPQAGVAQPLLCEKNRLFQILFRIGLYFRNRNIKNMQQIMRKYLSFWTLVMSGMLLFVSCKNDGNNGPGSGAEDVPQAVLAAYEKEYGSEPATWEIKGDYALARITRSGETAWFDLKTAFCGMKETDIRFDQLPQAVQAAFGASAYKDWRIDDVDMLTRSGSETLYVIEAEMGGQEVDLYYAEDGILVQEFLDAETGDYHEYFPQTPSVDIESWVADNLGADARIVDFDYEDGRIEVEVIAGGLKHEVLFSADSQWLQTTTEYEDRTLNLVPQEVIAAAQAEHPNARVEDVEKITTAELTLYCVELEQNDRDYKVFVDAATYTVVNRPSLPEDEVQGGTSVGSDYETFINEKYAGAVIVERDDDDGMVEIEIIHDNVKKEVKFRGGEWVRTEWEAPLPDEIAALIRDAGYEPEPREWADVVETAKGIAYEVEARKNGVEYDVYVDEAGQVTARRD